MPSVTMYLSRVIHKGDSTRTSSRSSNVLTTVSGSRTSLPDVNLTSDGMNPYRANDSTD